jgi:hypothetical protein
MTCGLCLNKAATKDFFNDFPLSTGLKVNVKHIPHLPTTWLLPWE